MYKLLKVFAQKFERSFTGKGAIVKLPHCRYRNMEK